MNRAAVILAVVSAMFLGIALGFMGGIFFSHHMTMRGESSWPMRMHGGHGAMHGGGRPFMGPPPSRIVMPQLKRLLDLTPDQATAIRAELEQTSNLMATERDSLRSRIERHLNPAQKQKLGRLLRERHPGDFGGPHARPDRDGPGPEGEDHP